MRQIRCARLTELCAPLAVRRIDHRTNLKQLAANTSNITHIVKAFFYVFTRRALLNQSHCSMIKASVKKKHEVAILSEEINSINTKNMCLLK